MPAAPRRVILERRRRLRRTLLVAGLGLTVLLYIGPVRSYFAASRAEAGASRQLQLLERRHSRLEHQLATLRSNAAMEALARQEGYIKPGETPYVVHVPSG